MEGNFGFIGLGAMGFPMAENIRRKMSSSKTMYVYDVYRPSCERFVNELGGIGPIEIVGSVKDVTENSSVVISIVPSAEDVRKVFLDGKEGAIAARKDAERLFLECSTIDAQTTRDVGETLTKAGSGSYIDTPVSGGVPGAAAGTLSFLIGHTDPTDSDPMSKTLATVLAMMGEPKKFFYCGKLGAGLAAKISNNYLSCTTLLAVAEAMAIGIRSGIDKDLLYRVIHNSTGQSWMCDNVMPVPGVVPHVPSSNGYKLGFKSQMMIKDTTLGIDAGHATGIRPVMAEAAVETFKKAAEDPRCIDRDGSSVYLYITDTKDEDWK
ncbi:putative 3-hydroxyisobutyrate dehydrogenase [Lineolata rhizophorae]|uniref:3-hydroxyisobutyrate dehydrogenase n=1 Tax=Lineolata rhizophorae TaxID=578093 RepID=A0A6A6PF89_9PEZI|nr:putative 3-hydroxyisobutyrate dehydrogenase [Lineolata rhizophorae]